MRISLWICLIYLLIREKYLVNSRYTKDWEAAKEILVFDKGTKTILMSSDSTVKQKALSNGVGSFKYKTLNLERLFNNIEKLIQ